MRGVRIYHYDLDRLLLDVIEDESKQLESTCRYVFWERGCVGGRHLSFYFEPQLTSLWDQLVEGVLRRSEDYVSTNPSVLTQPVPSHRAITRLLSQEGKAAHPEDFTQNSDVCVLCARDEETLSSLGPGAADFLYNFLSGSCSIVLAGLREAWPKQDLAIMLLAGFVVHCYPTPELGCLTLCGHWANYDQWFRPRELIERVRDEARMQEDYFWIQVAYVLDGSYPRERLALLHAWFVFLDRMDEMAWAKIDGNEVSFPSPNLHNLETTLASIGDNPGSSSSFLRLLYNSPSYMGVDVPNRDMWRTRLLINCVYSTLTNLGLSVFERIVTCYGVHQAIGRARQIDFIDVLKTRIHTYDAKHRGRAEL